MTMKSALDTDPSRHAARHLVEEKARLQHLGERFRPAASPGSRAIYLPAEIASYLRAASPVATWAPTPRQVYGWIRRGLLAPAVRDAPESSIVTDFDDLVTAQAISLLRAAGISLRAVERAEAFFTDLYGIGRPFAHRHFWTSGRDILGDLDGRLIAGTRGGQFAMPFMEEPPCPIATELVFDPRTGRPTSWYPVRHIELRPTVQYGQPCIAGTSILTVSVGRYARWSDAPALVAGKLGLDASDVEAALAWERARAYQRVTTAQTIRDLASPPSPGA